MEPKTKWGTAQVTPFSIVSRIVSELSPRSLSNSGAEIFSADSIAPVSNEAIAIFKTAENARNI